MSTSRGLVAAAFLLQAVAATAGQDDDRQTLLDACSAIKKPEARARCFEALARLAEIATAPPVPPPPVSGQYDDFVKAAKAAINADLKDPSATVYRDLFISNSVDGPALCGELNAKNSYGGFIGFRRFYSTTRPTIQAIEIEGKRHWMDEAWGNFCRQKLAEIEN